MDLSNRAQVAASNLARAQHILGLMDVPCFLFLGTALGAYRDGDFCKGDIDDIDIGILKEHYEKREHIIMMMETDGFILEHHWCEHDGVAPEMSFTKQYAGWRSKVDFFFVTEHNNQMAWRFYANPIQTRLISQRFFKTFEDIVFYGETYKVPSPIEEYLEANYGPNWKIPIPRDEWNWEKDNKCNFTV